MYKYLKNRESNTRKFSKDTLSNKVSGFTLVELMVSISIFMLIMTMAMGSLLVTLDAKKKSEALSFTMDNLNFALESMTRNLRMGTDYKCVGTDCPSVSFTPSAKIAGSTDKVTYSIISRGGSPVTYTLQRCITKNANTDCTDIIASNININNSSSRFYVKGAGIEPTNPQIQASVYIKLSGSVKVKNDSIPFAIQTMVSQRKLEF